MRRRSHLAAILVAIVAVAWVVGGAQPPATVLAGDPLADAKAKQQALQQELAQQRAQLVLLKAQAASLSRSLDLAKSQLASVSAQYNQVASTLAQVRQDVKDVQEQLADLNSRIKTLEADLKKTEAEIVAQTQELAAREALLQDHLRSAYEQSQTSLLEVLLSANSLDDATNQVGYLLTVSDQDKALADEIRILREELKIKKQNLEDGRTTLRQARAVAQEQEQQLVIKRAELSVLQSKLAVLKKAWERQKAAQEAALNASLRAQRDLAAQIKKIQVAAAAQTALVKKLQAQQTAGSMVGDGFRWPEVDFTITQSFGPTTFALEPSYTYQGTYYAHFHTGIDIANGCGTPILAAATGIVAASGQPLSPYDSAYGVIINHGAGIQSWYWHMQPRVVVSPGQKVTRGQLIGYEGSTGFATGCHVHFAINVNGDWRNPTSFLP
jgi:murein DD-endopeptidase MepM/ murein hydrolase activator NlpD